MRSLRCRRCGLDTFTVLMDDGSTVEVDPDGATAGRVVVADGVGRWVTGADVAEWLNPHGGRLVDVPHRYRPHVELCGTPRPLMRPHDRRITQEASERLLLAYRSVRVREALTRDERAAARALIDKLRGIANPPQNRRKDKTNE